MPRITDDDGADPVTTGTARRATDPVTQPTLNARGWLRFLWRQLTSMRTALFLLLMLAVAAVPGSVFPQRNIDATRTADWIADHPTAGPILDRLGFVPESLQQILAQFSFQ